MISRLRHWFTVKRVCCWCARPHYLGGNPFARKVSHGICPKAMAKALAETRRPA